MDPLHQEPNNSGGLIKEGVVYVAHHKVVSVAAASIIVGIIIAGYFLGWFKGDGVVKNRNYPVTSVEEKEVLLDQMQASGATGTSPLLPKTKYTNETVPKKSSPIATPIVLIKTTQPASQNTAYGATTSAATKNSILDAMSSEYYPTTSREEKEKMFGGN